jgi:DNA-binding response OmpR family regulator
MQNDLVIYYVDDDPEDLDVLAEIGISMGIEVIPISESDQVYAEIKHTKQGPKVIFLDVNMPLKSGYDLLEEFKHSDTLHGLPIVTFSTGHDLETIEKCWQLGADMYIRKGSSLDSYKKILRRVMAIDWRSYVRNEDNFILTA